LKELAFEKVTRKKKPLIDNPFPQNAGKGKDPDEIKAPIKRGTARGMSKPGGGNADHPQNRSLFIWPNTSPVKVE